MNAKNYFIDNIGFLNWSIVDPNFIEECTSLETDQPVLIRPDLRSLTIAWFDDGKWYYESATFPYKKMTVGEIKEWLAEEINDDYMGEIEAGNIFEIVNTLGDLYSDDNPVPTFVFTDGLI